MARRITIAHPRTGAPSREGARVACFDWLRAAGCVAVVALHVVVSLVNAVGTAQLAPARVLVENLFVVTLTRWAVPCFLMVSGALLLDPERKLGWRSIGRYVQRMLFTLGTFGLAFCLIESVYDHRSVSFAVVGEAAWHLLTGRSWDHLWYVYALLGLYALTPALRALVARLDVRSLGTLLAALYVATLVIPTALWTQGEFPATPFNVIPALFYYLLGWCTWRYITLDVVVLAAGGVSLVALIVAAIMGQAVLALPEFCLVAPYAVLVFCLFRRYATCPVGELPVVAGIADRSFGIYVIHPLFLHMITHLMDPLSVPAGIYELLAFVIALEGSYVLVGLLRRIPGVERWI